MHGRCLACVHGVTSARDGKSSLRSRSSCPHTPLHPSKLSQSTVMLPREPHSSAKNLRIAYRLCVAVAMQGLPNAVKKGLLFVRAQHLFPRSCTHIKRCSETWARPCERYQRRRSRTSPWPRRAARGVRSGCAGASMQGQPLRRRGSVRYLGAQVPFRGRVSTQQRHPGAQTIAYHSIV